MSSGIWPQTVFPNVIFPKRVFPKVWDYDKLGEPVKEFEYIMPTTCFDVLEHKTDFDEIII